ncbi:hypothetical protein A9G24_05380 [Gilliamella sp. App6-5]|uniref:tyrosine-type recombinase/integrase n=1 Tax=Gilliamella sp. App6-5 TaxID=3120232 RepID=UPI00080E5D8A|nr:tyrosine-type recombinase/integrase [Gilliamella apicola]OCG15401.1 hypothetical protein A9G24_05380 [Gilliamella apicola]
MASNKLTDIKIKNLKIKEKNYEISDGNSLSILIKKNGSKIWRFRYLRPNTKKANQLSLGEYPLISLAEAREKRDEFKKLLLNGTDPANYKYEEEEQIQKEEKRKFINIFWDWVEDQKLNLDKGEITEGTFRRNKNIIVNHVLIHHDLVNKSVNELIPADFKEYLQPLINQNKTDLVARICQVVGRVFNYAKNLGFVEYNKFENLRFATHRSKNMPTLPPAQLPQILKTINDYPATKQTKLLAYFQLLTLVRPGEAATAKWMDIDLKKSIWTIPANSMKMRREHVVPLSKQAIKILQKMKDITPPDFEYVFINRKYLNDKSKHTSKETVNTMLKRAGFKNKLVAHGFRSIASTILNESLKFHQELIEISLAHVDKNIVRATYNNAQYLEKRFELMGWWGDYVENVSNVSVL